MMTNRIGLTSRLSLLVLLVGLTGCNTTVDVKATAHRSPVSLAGQPVSVSASESTSDPYLNQHISRQLKRALAARGVPGTDKSDGARYRMEFAYSMDAGDAEVSKVPPAVLLNQRTRKYDVVTSPLGEVYYTKRLQLRLFSIADPNDAVWIGEAVHRSQSNSLRDVVDFLIAACVEKLGQETGNPMPRRFWSFRDPIGSLTSASP